MSINEMLGQEEINDEGQDNEEVDGGESSGNQGKTLTQDQVNKIVEERIARERKKFSDIDDLRAIAESLKQYGYSGSTKEIKEQLATAVQAQLDEQTLSELQEQAEEYGTSPELLKKIHDLEKKIAASEEKEKAAKEAEKRQQQEKANMEQEWERQKSDFADKYPDADLKGLANNPKFMKFAERANPNMTLTEVFESYIELVEGTEAEALAKVQSKASRATNSGRGKGSAESGTYGLTTRQQELARSSGMTFKDYANRLKEIQ